LLYWKPNGNHVKLSKDRRSAKLKISSGAVLSDRTFSEGIHRWCIRVISAAEQGCRYIGVSNSTDIDFDHNFQSGASGHRAAWDGSCGNVYFDINTYQSFICSTWTTGDSVEVELECEKSIRFFKNTQKIFELDVSHLKKVQWTPAVGFGYTPGQIVTFCNYRCLTQG